MSKSASLVSALLCTFIWGTTFIAQDTGMDTIGPLTFNAVRFLVGFISIIPIAIIFVNMFINFPFVFFCKKNNNTQLTTS